MGGDSKAKVDMRTDNAERLDLEALAQHFDATDAADEAWEPADAVIERPELEQVSVRISKEDLVELRRRAAAAGIGFTTLMRMVVREYLHRDSAVSLPPLPK